MLNLRLILYLFMLDISESIPLFEEIFEEESSRSSIPCCIGLDIDTCRQTRTNMKAYGAKYLEIPGINGSLILDSLVGGSNDTLYYRNNHAEAVINFNKENGGMHGDISTDSGDFFFLEYCGTNVHTLKRMNVARINKKKCLILDPKRTKRSITTSEQEEISTIQKSSYLGSNRFIRWLFPSKGSKEVTITVKIYYTPEFARSTPDLEGFFNQIIDKTNQGYKNSKVNLQVKIFCTEMTTIHETNSLRSQIYQFAVMKENSVKLIGSADFAVLFVNDDPDACGVTLSYNIDQGTCKRIIGVVKACAIENQAFAHQLGHLMGLGHTQQDNINKKSKYKDANGLLLDKGKSKVGYHTIMAYPYQDHQKVINYYSNPDVIFPETGTPTGIRGKANNARILELNKKALAQFGTEKEDCYIQKRLSPTCIMQKEAIRYETKYVTMKKDDFHNEYSQCAYPCKVHSGNFCQGFEVNKREHKCKNFIMRTVSDEFSSWGPLNNPRCENLKLRYVYKIQGPVQTRVKSRSFEAETELICHGKCVYAPFCMRWTFHFRTKKCTFYRFDIIEESIWKKNKAYDQELYTTYHSEKEFERLRKREKLK